MPIKLVSSTSKSLTVEWEPYSRALKYVMACRPIQMDDSDAEIVLDSTHQINSSNVQRTENVLTVINLHPKTRYVFWLSFWFENRHEPYVWPQEERFVFETYADRPNAPGKPIIAHVKSDVYQVKWKAAEGNGAPIEEYSLEGLRYRASSRATRSVNSTDTVNQTLLTKTLANEPFTAEDVPPVFDEWTEYYRGNSTFWLIKDLVDPIAMYSFRVRARNANGWSEYSALSEPITAIDALSTHKNFLLIAAAAPALVAILIIGLCCVLCKF